MTLDRHFCLVTPYNQQNREVHAQRNPEKNPDGETETKICYLKMLRSCCLLAPSKTVGISSNFQDFFLQKCSKNQDGYIQPCAATMRILPSRYCCTEVSISGVCMNHMRRHLISRQISSWCFRHGSFVKHRERSGGKCLETEGFCVWLLRQVGAGRIMVLQNSGKRQREDWGEKSSDNR